jgi:hypothetical protein
MGIVLDPTGQGGASRILAAVSRQQYCYAAKASTFTPSSPNSLRVESANVVIYVIEVRFIWTTGVRRGVGPSRATIRRPSSPGAGR